MHVDGFRFDLASALARSLHDVDKLSSFFDTIHQDPVISQVKLIAEPWDVGDGGYQVGEFPPLWTEWNGKYRDTVRSFWAHGADDGVRDLAYRLSGSSDLYGDDGRLPIASINFVTAHDGFTMRDLVSYERKHNEANGEDNRDGTDDNRSYNCGVEGDPAPPEVQRAAAAAGPQPARARCCCRPARRCSSPATSAGARSAATTTPTCRTTRSPGSTGRRTRPARTCSRSTRRLLALRRAAPGAAAAGVLRGTAGATAATACKDLAWFHPAGRELTADDWFDTGLRSIGMYLDGRGLRHRDAPRRDDRRRLVPAAAALRRPRRPLPPARPAVGARATSRSSTPARSAAGPAIPSRSPAAPSCRWPRGRCCCCERGGPTGRADYARSWRRTHTSRTSSSSAAAIGRASSAPTMPATAPPISTATIVTYSGTSIDERITRG